MPVLQFLDIKCKVLHCASNFLAAPPKCCLSARAGLKASQLAKY